MFKQKKTIKTLLILSAISVGIAQPVMSHELTYSAEQRYGVNVPTLKANIDSVDYSSLVYGFQMNLSLEGAVIINRDPKAIKKAITLSSPNKITPRDAAYETISFWVDAEYDLRAVNSITITIDESILNIPHSISLTLPVFHDILPSDLPHEDANKQASLNVDSVKSTDFLQGSGKVFTINLKEGHFLPGCADPIADSIKNSSNVPGLVRIWRKTNTQVEFVVEGGFYAPVNGNWNFELSPETNTLGQKMFVTTPITYD